MSSVTQILSAIEQGDPTASEQLLPLVYDELRKLAAARLAQEKPGQTLQSTALVHEAYLRLVGTQNDQRWNSRGHFFGAAAEAMRRILVEQARRKQSFKHGGDIMRHDLQDAEIIASTTDERILEVNEALNDLAKLDPQAAELVKLRYFVGLSAAEAAEVLGVSARTGDRIWVYAKSYLLNTVKQP